MEKKKWSRSKVLQTYNCKQSPLWQLCRMYRSHNKLDYNDCTDGYINNNIVHKTRGINSIKICP